MASGSGMQALFRLGAWCLACLCVAAFGGEYYTEEVNAGMSRLIVKCTEQSMLDSLGFYAAKCSMLVDHVLDCHEPQKFRLLIFERGEDGLAGDLTPGLYQVAYSVGEDELAFALRLFRQLLVRRLSQVTHTQAKETPFLGVVAAGLTHRYVRGRHSLSGYYEPDYEFARNQFMRRQYPNLSVLFGSSPALAHPYFFELFMMHSDLLLLCFDALPKEAGKCLCEVLVAEQSGEEAVEAFERLTVSVRQPNESVQGFYERMAYKVSRRRRRQSGEDVIAERVRELETVPVVSVEAGSALRRVPLEDVPEVLKDYCADIQGVLRLENRFMELRGASPYLLRDSLEAYARALSWLRAGEVDRFKEDIVRAREQFGRALARQKKLAERMNRYEQEHIPALRRFHDYMVIMRLYRDLGGKLYPRDIFEEHAGGVTEESGGGQ